MAAVIGSMVAEGLFASRMQDVTLVSIGVLLISSVTHLVRRRYPERPLWVLLFAIAVAYSLQPLDISSNPLLFTLARVARWGMELSIFWLMVVFPTGRLQSWREKALVASGALPLLLTLAALMFAPQFPRSSFSICGGGCSTNLFFVANKPQWSAAFMRAGEMAGAGITIAALYYLFLRLRNATVLMRRMLAPVLIAFFARLLNISAALLSPDIVLVTAPTLWAIPLAISLGLLRGRLYAARALHHLVTGLRSRPGTAELRDVMAEALDDPSLQLGYWDTAEGKWLDSARQILAIPDPALHGRASSILHDSDNNPVAILIYDAALREEPLLLDAVISSMNNAILSHQMESTLAGERSSSLTAIENERRRIERDLHDGSQQRLLALRMKVSVAKRLLENDSRRAAELLAEMGTDVDEIVTDLRSVSHGIVPALLAEQGLAAALSDAARHSANPVIKDLQDVGRCDPAVESAIYFCCTEALQNVAKHAGEAATVSLGLRCTDDAITFVVEDNGGGIEGARATNGHGMKNMKERILAVGGQLEITNAQGSGAKISGTVPRTRTGSSDEAPAIH